MIKINSYTCRTAKSLFFSDIAIFVLKKDVNLQLTNYREKFLCSISYKC